MACSFVESQIAILDEKGKQFKKSLKNAIFVRCVSKSIRKFKN